MIYINYKYVLYWLGVITIICLLTVHTKATTQQRGNEEICETLPSEIHLIKGWKKNN